jgi:hypothetical protein
MKSLLRDWLHSAEGAFAGHFHWTPGLIGVVVVVALILFGWLRMRSLSAVEAPSRSTGGAVVVGLTALALGVAVLLDRHAPAAVKSAVAKPHPAVTHVITRTVTRTVTKAAPSHFQVTGTEIVIMICVFLVAWVATKAIGRGRG